MHCEFQFLHTRVIAPRNSDPQKVTETDVDPYKIEIVTKKMMIDDEEDDDDYDDDSDEEEEEDDDDD
jgi:hypothetical protein